MKKLDWKYILIMIFLVTLAFLSFKFKNSLFEIFSWIFEQQSLILIFVVISAAIDITHTLKYKNLSFSHSMSFSQFKKSFEFISSFVGNPITLVSSIALTKGLFLQWTGQEIYFPLFLNHELIFIAIIVSYLMVVSCLELKKHFVEILSVPPKKDELTPTENPNN